MQKTIGLSVALGICVGAFLLGGSISLFINIPSLLIVGCMTFGLLYARYGGEGLNFAWKSANPRRKQIALYGGRVAMISGWIGSLIGWVQMAENMTDMQAFGPALAVSLLTIFYGHMLHLFYFMPYQYSPESEPKNDYENEFESPSPVKSIA